MSSANDPNAKKNYDSEIDPQSLRVVRGKYSQLQSMIESLNDKLNVVAEFQEKEFLSAYRVHMLSVQLELKELQEKVAKAEMLLQDDGEVSKLEEECNWFRNETNRLQTHSAAMQHDIQALKTRLTALRDQNQYLSSQLKAVMKRSRVLEVEIDMAKQNIEIQTQDQQQLQSRNTTPSSHSHSRSNHHQQQQHQQHLREDDNDDLGEEFEDDNEDGYYGDGYNERQRDIPSAGTGDGSGLGKSLSAIALGNRPIKSTLNTLTMRRVQSVGPDVLIPQKNHRNISPPQSPSSRRHPLSNSMKRTAAGRLRGTIQQNKSQQELTKDLQQEIKQLQKQLNTLETTKSFVEMELEQNIRQVFQSVIKRKSLAVAKNSKNRYFRSLAKQAEEAGQDSIEQELESFQFTSKTPADRLGHPVVGGISNLGLEHLTDIDRKEAMIGFLSQSEIFEEIVSSIQAQYY